MCRINRTRSIAVIALTALMVTGPLYAQGSVVGQFKHVVDEAKDKANRAAQKRLQKLAASAARQYRRNSGPSASRPSNGSPIPKRPELTQRPQAPNAPDPQEIFAKNRTMTPTNGGVGSGSVGLGSNTGILDDAIDITFLAERQRDHSFWTQMKNTGRRDYTVDLSKVFPNLKNELILGVGDTGHFYLFVNGQQVHGGAWVQRFLIESEKTYPIEGFFFRFKDVPETLRAEVLKNAKDMEGWFTLSCVNVACTILERSGIKVAGTTKTPTFTQNTFLRILRDGFEWKGKPVQVQVYKATSFTDNQLLQRMWRTDNVYAPVFGSLLVPYPILGGYIIYASSPESVGEFRFR
jgi:hypothetical protein